MKEEQVIADRMSGYADAVAAFSLVNALGFLLAVAEMDTRCSLVQNRRLVLSLILLTQALYAGAVIVLRRVEVGMREGHESSERVTTFRRHLYQGRLVFVSVVTIAMTLLSWFALDSGSCSPT